jgi:hypothetical protein
VTATDPRPAEASRVGLFSPLGWPDYRWALGGRLLSLTGDFAQSVILAVLVLDITQRPSGWGVLLTIQAIPRALLMLAGGVAVDRFQARSVMLVSNLVQATGGGRMITFGRPGPHGRPHRRACNRGAGASRRS